MNKKKVIIFYSINPLNYIFAFIFSLFFPVYFWRKFLVSEVLLKKFNQLYEYGSFDMQEWHTMISPIFRSFKEEIKRNNNISNNELKLKIDRFHSDLMPAAIQEIALDYERIYQFFNLIAIFLKKNQHYKVFIVNFNIIYKLKRIGVKHNHEINVYNFFFKFNIFLENMMEWFYTFFLIFRNLYFFIINIFATEKMNPKKVLFYKFSSLEIGYNQSQRSIINLLIKGITNSDDYIFYIYGKVNKSQTKLMRENKINFITENDVFKIVSKKNQCKSILWMFRNLLFQKNTIDCLLITYFLKQLIRDINLIFLCYQMNIKLFVNSHYGGITETPIVSFLKSNKVKTIFWNYYNMGYKYFNSDLKNSYNFELVEDCISLSEYRYLWSEIDVDIIKKRNLNGLLSEKINFISIGPVMLGNNKYNKLSPEEVRKLVKFNGNQDCKTWVSIFDIPTFYPYKHTEHRWLIGNHNEVSIDKFFKMLIETMQEFSDVGFIYKPKRSLQINNRAWKITNMQREFTNKRNAYVKNRQLVILDDHVNPYLPLMLCNHGVGMTFTSAITAANYFNRNSIYLDLSRKENSQIYPKSLNEIIISNKCDFFSIINIWRKQEKFIKTHDPIENFNLELKKFILETE